MKFRFLILFTVLVFVFLGCGDDPESSIPYDGDSFEKQDESEDENLPDGAGSGSENDSDKVQENTDNGGETPDSGTTDNDSGQSDGSNDPADNETTSDDDTETVPDGGEAADDSDSQPENDADAQGPADDSEEQQPDSDAETPDSSETEDDSDAETETGDDDILTIVLPFGETAEKTMKFDTKINKIDVLLMVDLSGLLSAAHDNLKTNVKTAIIDRIRAEIPDSAFGLVKFGTFEATAEQGYVYTLAQPVTEDINPFRSAVDGISKVTAGSKTYHTLALWEAASGEEDYEQISYQAQSGFYETKYASISIPAVDCSGQAGNIGGACFRNNAMPVFVMASGKKFSSLTSSTDDKFGEWHAGEKKTKPKAVEKMNAIHAKFIGFSLSGESLNTSPQNDFKYIAEGTGSQFVNGDNFNKLINADDTALSYQIAEAVKNLAGNIKLNVKAEFAHNDNVYGVENTAEFIKSVYPDSSNTQYIKTGTQASFDITFGNNFYENTTSEQHAFVVTVKAVGEGIVLDSRDIRIVVPGSGTAPIK